MNKINVGETYKDTGGDHIEVIFFHEVTGFFIGYHAASKTYWTYTPDGNCCDTTEQLIIPPQLPWPWVVGDWYLQRDRKAVECKKIYDTDLVVQLGTFPNSVFFNDGRHKNHHEEDPNDIVAHLGPLPQGVYHVSDGDTQLLQDLKRWQERGGRIEAKADGGAWVFHLSEHPLATIAEYLIYRAHGYTGDREFPKPEPKREPLDRVVTIRDMIALRHYLNGECSHGDPCVNFWKELAESQP